MNILRVISSIDPRGGGPMESARRIDTQLILLGHNVEVVCLDNFNSDFLSSYPAVVHALGPSYAGYRFNRKIVPWLKNNSIRFDAVVVDGLWQYHSFATWLALRKSSIPYFIFTHGMLDPWFKKAYPLKHIKKWLYWPWSEYRVLRDASGVLFTCEEERVLAKQTFWLYKANEIVTSFGTASPPVLKNHKEIFLQNFPLLQEKRVLLFLGRIHPKKGCDVLLRGFANVAKSDDRLHLIMAGPDQSDLTPNLKALAEQLGIKDKVSWPGMISGDLKWAAFYSVEAFCLTSHQENFGIAVAEALACGTPVLISNKVNIWREIEVDNAGFVGDDNEIGATEILKRWLSLPDPSRQLMKKNAENCFNRRFRIEKVATDLADLINRQISK